MKVQRLRKFTCLHFVFCLLFISPALYAGESAEQVLDKFNKSVTAKEAMQYLTGSMKMQFASLNEEMQRTVLDHNRMEGYKTHVVPIDDNLQFVHLSDLVFPDEKRKFPPSMFYEFSKVDGQWKIQDRFSSYIILDLFKKKFSANQFHSRNSFQIDGTAFNMESAFAYYAKKQRDSHLETKITIHFYPFLFQERDIEYLKRNFGPIVNDTDKPTAIASSLKYPTSRLLIDLDEKNQPAIFCLNYSSFSGNQITDVVCLPLNLASMSKLMVTENELNLTTHGQYQKHDGKTAKWDINLQLPLFEKGIH